MSAKVSNLREQFEADGFLILPGYWDASTCVKLKDRMQELIQDFDLEGHRTVFSTNEQHRTSDAYFLDSGSAVRFFWEENAFDDAGNFRQERSSSINKVGHALHDLDTVFQEATYTTRLGQIARAIGGLQVPLAVQSMYIFKQPRIGGKVSAHQDGTFLYTNPQSVVGFWWALEDCTQQNGCLWAVPGSHKLDVRRRFCRKGVGSDIGTCFRPEESTEYCLEGARPLEVSAGSLIVLHHALVHYSAENRSNQSRHAYSVHVIDGTVAVDYPTDNWLQRPADFPFRPLP